MSRDAAIPATDTPRLAVLLPAFDPGNRITATLQSIAEQDVDCEIFVVDDGSDPALDLPAQLGRYRLNLIRLPRNRGIAHALNVGLAAILERDFEFVARHDAGDVDLAHRLQTQITQLDKHRDVALVGSSVGFVAPGGARRFTFDAPVTDPDIRRRMRYSAALIHSSCMFRASVLREVGRYDETVPEAEDYELFFRILRDHRVENIPNVLVRADYDVTGLSISRRRSSLRSRLRLQLRFFSITDAHAYLGAIQTILLFAIPYALVSRVKRWRGEPVAGRPQLDTP